VIIEAKQKELIPTAKETIDDLIAKAGFWLGQDLYESVLRAAGE
jgi:predicted nucleic acid-binding protein